MDEEPGPEPAAKPHPSPQNRQQRNAVVRGGAPLALAGAAAVLAIALLVRHSPNPAPLQHPNRQASAPVATLSKPVAPPAFLPLQAPAAAVSPSQPATIPAMKDAELQAGPGASSSITPDDRIQSGGPVYLNIGPRISEDPPEGDEVVFGCVFNTSFDNYRVVGDGIDVVIDGKKNRIPFLSSGIYPGAIKAIVRVPGLAGKHTVVFLPTYDLGKDGNAAVKIISSSDGMGGKTVAFESAVDREEGNAQARPLRVK